MKLIEPKPYQRMAPLVLLISGIIGIANTDLSKAIHVFWYIAIALSSILITLGIISHKKYLEKQNDASIDEE